MCSRCNKLAAVRQGLAQRAVRNYEWGRVARFFSESKQVVCVSESSTGLEGHSAVHPNGEEGREQQQGVFERLSEAIGLFDQRASLIERRLSHRCRIAFGEHQCKAMTLPAISDRIAARKPKPKPDDPEQSKRFIETAQEVVRG